MNTISETLTGIVNRVTYHNPDTGWSVLRVQPFNSPQQQETVTVHQTKVFAGATIEFRGAWTIDHKYGRQFKATEAIEKKPATTAAIEKYLGSGLIKGVGPKTAKRIVNYFQKETLAIFENDINRLTEVSGIAKKKLIMIEKAWTEHRAIRDVMMFLQGHGISTLFAVRIYKEYGDKAIPMVTEDPYRLANDFYGIGFFSADKVALSIGLSEDSQQRMIAAIKHVLAASREQGHCYLTEQQINTGIIELIEMNLGERLPVYLEIIKYAHQINKGQTPYIDSPFKKPAIWKNGADCLFIDSDEVTKEQLSFITKVKRHFDWKTAELETIVSGDDTPFEFRVEEEIMSAYEVEFVVPDKFRHVDLEKLHKTEAQVDALKSVLKNIHPWSSLHYGLSAIDIVIKLYLDWIPKYHGHETEIQILTPMTRGSLGTANLNKVIQAVANPPLNGKSQLKIGERIFREGDRVIHRRNNYDLNVFNGDIGKIITIDNEVLTCVVSFYPDNREVNYKKEDIMELDLAYAITIHKSQGSEFKAVIIPVLTQHFKMLYRNLIYTGLTRAKELAVFVGTRKALSMAIRQQDTSLRQTALKQLITKE